MHAGMIVAFVDHKHLIFRASNFQVFCAIWCPVGPASTRIAILTPKRII
jgi:hypothetical protein